MTRRHRILAAALAGPLVGLTGLGASEAAAQPAQPARPQAPPITVAEAQQARISGTIHDDRGDAVQGALVSAGVLKVKPS